MPQAQAKVERSERGSGFLRILDAVAFGLSSVTDRSVTEIAYEALESATSRKPDAYPKRP